MGRDDTEQALAEASEYLVDQMKEMQEELEDKNETNQELRRNYEDLCYELKKLQGEKRYLESCFQGENYSEENVFKAVMSMKARIDELYDLGEDLKVYSTKQEAESLNHLAGFIKERLKKLREVGNAKLTNKIEAASKSRQDIDKEENTVGFFSKLLGEKERKIEVLTGNLEKELRESREMQAQIEELRGKLDGLDMMCYGRLALTRHSGCSAEDQRTGFLEA